MYASPAGEEKRWQLEFNLRKSTPDNAANAIVDAQGEPLQTGVATENLQRAYARLSFFYGKKQHLESKDSPKKLVRELEELFRIERAQWSIGLLRALWPPLSRGITRRGRSLAHETTWLYLAGFCLRPGYGVQLDDWRMNQLWRAFELGLSFPKESSALVQWWIMWRRVAGGLSGGRQEQLLRKLIMPRLQKGAVKGAKPADEPELLRLAGSLERISTEDKLALGKHIAAKIKARQSGVEHYIWALGRLASRIPLYASAHQVVPPDTVSGWFQQLAELNWTSGDYPLLNGAFAQACRQTGDRHRDISDDVRREVLAKMQQSGAAAEQLRIVREYVEVELSDQIQLFGESLPSGLRLA